MCSKQGNKSICTALLPTSVFWRPLPQVWGGVWVPARRPAPPPADAPLPSGPPSPRPAAPLRPSGGSRRGTADPWAPGSEGPGPDPSDRWRTCWTGSCGRQEVQVVTSTSIGILYFIPFYFNVNTALLYFILLCFLFFNVIIVFLKK